MLWPGTVVPGPGLVVRLPPRPAAQGRRGEF